MITQEQLETGKYYRGRMVDSREYKTARWNGDNFIFWQNVKGQHAVSDEVEYGEFVPSEIVTWGTNYIPLRSTVTRTIESH